MLGVLGILVTNWVFCTSLSAAQSHSQCLTLYNYDITDEDKVLDSQADFDDQSSTYGRNVRRCIYVSTNTTDHVIKLEELYFLLENSVQCSLDYVTVYDSSGFINELGRYCDTGGPGTAYSTTSSMFIFFGSDSTIEFRGFRFILSSIHKDDVPGDFSATSIAALAICVAIVITIIGIFIFCVVKGAKKQHSNTVHVMPQVNRDRPYLVSPNYTNNRTQRNYVLPKPPSYQESIATNQTRNGQSGQTQNGRQQPQHRTGMGSSNQVSTSSSGAQTSGRRQEMYQATNTPDDIRYPMSPPPAYQP